MPGFTELPDAREQSAHGAEADRSALSRRHFLSGVAGAVAVTGAVAAGTALIGCSDSTAPYVDAASQAETDVLNFALTLELLEATFYSYLVTGQDISGTLSGGGPAPTGAPAQLTFPSAQVNDLFAEILFDETSHVGALKTALGSVAVVRPQINLAALGAITTANYLQVARFLEDVGTTAYTGAAQALTGNNAQAAAQILATEGFHAGALRLLAIQRSAAYPAGIPIPADGFDIKPADPGSVTAAENGPTTANGGFFATSANGTPGQTNTYPGFAFRRTPSQVLAILYGSAAAGTTKGGFFPNGINGNITTV